MNCEQVQQALLDSLRGQVADGIEGHLAGCDECREFAREQRVLDARLANVFSEASLSPQFREALRSKLPSHPDSPWSDSLPDLAHLIGCALGMALLPLFLSQPSKMIFVAGILFTALTYYLQAVLRRDHEANY